MCETRTTRFSTELDYKGDYSIMANSLQSAPDAELIDIGTQCFNAMNANLANYPGATQQMVDNIKITRDEFSPEVTAHVAQQAAARSQTQVKDAKRAPYEAAIALARNVSKAGGATEAAIAAAGVPSTSQKAPANATQPVGSVNTSQRLRHTISWTDAASPDNKKRPRGTIGCEIFNKLDGAPPIDVSECTYLALDSATPYLVEYPGTDAGKMAHYMLRWRMQDGSTSAWGETLSATITG